MAHPKGTVPDFEAEPPARAGYLWKRSDHVKKWNKRWFVLWPLENRCGPCAAAPHGKPPVFGRMTAEAQGKAVSLSPATPRANPGKPLRYDTLPLMSRPGPLPKARPRPGALLVRQSDRLQAQGLRDAGTSHATL